MKAPQPSTQDLSGESVPPDAGEQKVNGFAAQIRGKENKMTNLKEIETMPCGCAWVEPIVRGNRMTLEDVGGFRVCDHHEQHENRTPEYRASCVAIVRRNQAVRS
jgi:hypothetical protein